MHNLKNELRKSLYNIFFIIPCALGIILSLIYSYKVLDMYFEYRKHIRFDEVLAQNTLSPTFNAYMLWIGGPRLEDDKSSVIFFWYIILVAAIPYTWSYCAEIRKAKKEEKQPNNSISNKLTKYVAVFISSGLLAVIPLLINLLTTLLFVPATKPDPVYNIYYREFSSSLFGDIYYTFPIMYELLYILAFGAFCGMIGAVGYSVSLLIKNEVVAIASPLLFLLVGHLINNSPSFAYKCISPLKYMNVADEMFRNFRIMFIEMALMLLVTIFLVLITKPKMKNKAILTNIAEANK